MTRRILLGATAAAVLAILPAAQAKPDFSGDWKMNAEKSNYGPIPAPDKLVRKITHEEPSLKYTTTQSGQQGEITTNIAYTTDGKECVNKVPTGEAKGTAKWDGDKLLIDSKREIQGNELSFKDVWSLSADGKTLTIDSHITTPQGEFDLKLVLDKQ